MKQLNNAGSLSFVLCLLVPIFIVLGAYNASAAPQTLPFDFSPGIGDLLWEAIDDTDDCFDSQTVSGLNIDDAIDASGNIDAYDGAWFTAVNTTSVKPNGIGDLTGNTYTAVPQNISGLDVTYQLFFSADTQCNRLVLFFDNTTGSPINETVRIETNFGSDSDTQVDGTSSGDTIFTTADRWIVTSDGGVEDDPVLTTVFYGPGSPAVTPTSVTQEVCDLPIDGVGVTFDITVPGDETRCLMLFGCLADITGLDNTVAGALAAAPLFNSNDTIPGDLLSGLTQEQLNECLNWDSPPATSPTNIPTLSEWGLIAMAGILGIVGFMVMRRRKVTA